MATLYLKGGTLEFGWKVTGITSTTSVTAIFDRSFSDGGTTQPRGLIDSTTSQSMTSYRYVDVSSPGSKKIYYGAKNKTSGKWYCHGYETVYVEDEEPLIKVPMPRLSYTPTKNSCKITWSRPTGASSLCYQVWPYGGSQPSGFSSVDAYSGSVTISNLTPDTTYKVRAYYRTNASGYEDSDIMYDSSAFTTVSLPTFAWDTTPYTDNPFSVTKRDWDRLQDTIDKRRDYPRAWRYKASTGSPLTYSMWNEVITVLNNCSVSGIPPQVSSGDICYASYFRDLATCVNKIKP